MKHRERREADIDQDRCPECGGELDTGWECNKCGFDAICARCVDPDKAPKETPREHDA